MYSEAGKTLPREVGEPDQRLALHVLNGMDLVPEHVERRSLYNPTYPNIEQVSVSIFPHSLIPTACICMFMHAHMHTHMQFRKLKSTGMIY